MKSKTKLFIILLGCVLFFLYLILRATLNSALPSGYNILINIIILLILSGLFELGVKTISGKLKRL